jgi:tRNA(fMet)-specific endonuclease VapC
VRYLLDTNVCVYSLKNRPPEVLEHLQAVGRAAVAVSVITVLELRHGAEKSQQREASLTRLELFLAPMNILPFEENDARIGGRIRAHLDRTGRRIGDLDSLIAAQALARDMILVTNNLREFERVPDLRTENWVA